MKADLKNAILVLSYIANLIAIFDCNSLVI